MLKHELPEELKAVQTIALYAKGEKVEGELVDHPAVLIIRGNKLYMDGKFSEAYRVYRAAYSKNKSLVEARVNMGFALVRMGRDEEARDIFENLPDAFVNEYVLNELGNIYARRGFLDKAEEYYRKAMEKNPNFTLPKLNFAVLALSRGDAEEAYEKLREIREIESAYKPYFFKIAAMIECRLGKVKEALEHVNKFIEIKEDHASWLLKAECEGRLGNYVDAEKSAKRAYDLKPTVSAQIAIAAFKLENGEVDEAVNIAKKALTKKIRDHRLYKVLARAYFLQEKYSKAYEFSTRALELKDLPSIRMIHGECARRLGKYEKALEDADAVLGVNPNFRNAKILKALALANLGRPGDALEWLKSAGGDDFLIYTAFSEVYALMGDKRKCAEALENALKHRESIPHLRKLCLLLYELGELKKMEKYIKRLSDIESKDAFVWFLRGEILFGENPDEAEKYYKMAVEIDDKFADAYMKLAAIAVMHNDAEKVKEYIAKLVELGASAKLWDSIFRILLDHHYYEEIIKYMGEAVKKTGEEELRVYEVRAQIALKRYEEAEALAGELVKKFPEMSEAKLYLGISEYYLKKYGLAMRRFEKLVKTYELDAYYYIARIHFDSGRAADALEITDKYGYDSRFIFLKMEILYSLKSYDSLLEYIAGVVDQLSGENLTRALIYRMKAYFAKGERERGLSTGLEIMDRDPDNLEVMHILAQEYLSAGEYENAEKYSAMALSKEEDKDILFLHARALYALGRYDDALADMEKLIKIEEMEDYLLLSAKIYFAMERYEDVKKLASRVLEKNRNSVEALVLLGKVAYMEKDYVEAGRRFEKVFLKDVGNYDALYYLSLIYSNLKEYEKSEKMFERAFERYADRVNHMPEFIETYAEVLYNLGKYSAVIEFLGDRKELTDAMHLVLGKAKYMLRDYPDAESNLQEVKSDVLKGEKIYYLTLSLMAENRFEEAEKLLREMKDEKGEILYYHGLVLFNLGKYTEAVDKFQKFLDGGGENRELPYYMGVSLFNIGKYSEALKYLEKGEKVNERSFVYEALSHYNLKDMERAVQFFEICVKKGLIDGEMWFRYGDALEALGKDPLNAYLEAWKSGYREPELAYRLVKKYMGSGDAKTAIKFADAAAPVGDDARILGARAYANTGDFSHAYELVKNVTRDDVLPFKARILISLGRIDEAEHILMSKAEDPESAYELVKLLILRGRYGDAKKFMATAEKYREIPYEKMIVYYNTEDWENALLNAELVVESGEKVEEASYIAGVSLYNLGKYDEAIKYLKRANGADVDYYVGMAYYSMGDYEHAAKYLVNAESGREELGMSLYNVGEYVKALEVFKSIDSPTAKEYAGLCAYRIGDYAQAVEMLKGTEHREELAESYFMLGKYEEVISLNPENMRVLGMAHYHLGHMKEAAKALEMLRDKTAEDYYYLALAQIKTEDYSAAERSISRAKSLGYEGDLSEFEGVIAYMKGEYQSAVSLLKNARDPDNRRLYGMALFHTGRFGEASEVLRDYDDEESRTMYAKSLMEIGTEESLRTAERIFSDLKDVKGAAACALRLGDYDRVVAYLEGMNDGESLSMKFEAYLKLGRGEDAARIYVDLPESEKAAYAKQMCELLLNLKRHDEAEVVMKAYFYEDYEWLMLRTKLHIAKGENEEAIKTLRTAKKLNPREAEISRLLAPLLLNAGHEDEALTEAKNAVKKFPDDAVCWYNLGLAYHRTGKPKKAIEALEKSVELDETLWEAWHLLGLIHLDARRYEEAYAALSHVKDRIKDRGILVSLAMTAYQLEKYEDALTYIDSALSMGKDHMALYYRALILVELGRDEEAMENLKEAIEMNPGFVEARKLLGSIMGGE